MAPAVHGAARVSESANGSASIVEEAPTHQLARIMSAPTVRGFCIWVRIGPPRRTLSHRRGTDTPRTVVAYDTPYRSPWNPKRLLVILQHQAELLPQFARLPRRLRSGRAWLHRGGDRFVLERSAHA